jgi:hypothetical protein
VADWADDAASKVNDNLRGGLSSYAVDHIADALRQARLDALEEAAKACDAYAGKDWRLGEGFRHRAALDLAAGIRFLKGETK